MMQASQTAATTAAPMPYSLDVPTPANDAETLEQLLRVSTTVLYQAVEVVDSHLTSDEQLTIHSKFLPGSTIGIPSANPYGIPSLPV